MLCGCRHSDIDDAKKIAAGTREYGDRFLSPMIVAEWGYIDDVIMSLD